MGHQWNRKQVVLQGYPLFPRGIHPISSKIRIYTYVLIFVIMSNPKKKIGLGPRATITDNTVPRWFAPENIIMLEG